MQYIQLSLVQSSIIITYNCRHTLLPGLHSVVKGKLFRKVPKKGVASLSMSSPGAELMFIFIDIPRPWVLSKWWQEFHCIYIKVIDQAWATYVHTV